MEPVIYLSCSKDCALLEINLWGCPWNLLEMLFQFGSQSTECQYSDALILFYVLFEPLEFLKFLVLLFPGVTVSWDCYKYIPTAFFFSLVTTTISGWIAITCLSVSIWTSHRLFALPPPSPSPLVESSTLWDLQSVVSTDVIVYYSSHFVIHVCGTSC